jgi:hypothetical protein
MDVYCRLDGGMAHRIVLNLDQWSSIVQPQG